MRKFILLAASAAAMVATPAFAATVVYMPGVTTNANESVIFRASPMSPTAQMTSPTIVGTISNIISTAGMYTDDFRFTIPQNGIGSGSLTSSSTSPTDGLTFTSVTFNGVTVPIIPNGAGGQTASLSGFNIISGMQNDLIVSFTAAANSSFGGNLTFQSAVPEVSTWAMMMVGFGMMGFGLRRRKSNVKTTVSFA